MKTTALIKVAGTKIPVTSGGLVDLVSLYKASGGDADHHPGVWASLSGTKNLISSAVQQFGNGCWISDGDQFFANEPIAIAYASFVSPDFQLAVAGSLLSSHRNSLGHSSTPSELRSRIDSVLEAKEKGLLNSHEAKIMTKEALRSGWSNDPVISSKQKNGRPLFQRLMSSKIKLTGESFSSPVTMTVLEAVKTVAEDEYGAGEALEAINNLGLDIKSGDLAINAGSRKIRDLFDLSQDEIEDRFFDEPAMMKADYQVRIGSAVCKPMLIPIEAL